MAVTREQIEARGFEEMNGEGRRLLLFQRDDGSRLLWDSETGQIYRAEIDESAEDTRLLLMELVLLVRELLEDPSAARKMVLVRRLEHRAFPQPITTTTLPAEGGRGGR